MICSTLASLWKFQYFRRSIYNPVEHLWWSFYCKNNKPLSIFTKNLHRRCSLRFLIHLCFYLKTLQTFYFFITFYIILRLLKSVISLKYFLLLIHQIIKLFDLLNSIPLTRTKTFVNNLLMSKFFWKSSLEYYTFEIVILNTKWRDCKSSKNLCTKNFTYTTNFTYTKLPLWICQKFTSWKTQRKHVNQTTAI